MIGIAIEFIALAIALLMFIYGIYVVFKGEVGAGDGIGGKLIGKPARKIGFIYMLAPIVAVINIIVSFIVIILLGASIEEAGGYGFVYLLVLVATLFLFLFAIVKLSKRMYDKQNTDASIP